MDKTLPWGDMSVLFRDLGILPSGVSVASEARPIIAFYSRFRDICIYMSVCTCIAQDRAHLTQVLSRRPLCIWNTGCYSEHHFEESPFR